MKVNNLLRFAAGDIRRSFRSLAFAGIGIVVGIASLVFFVGLGHGMRDVVLGKIFVVDHLEVLPRSYDLGLLKVGGGRAASRLDKDSVDQIEGIEGVAGVYPKMRFAFKAMGSTGKSLVGRDVYFELFADGIDPSLVAEELAEGADFSRRPDDSPIPILVSPQLLEFFNSSVAGVFNMPRLGDQSLIGLKGHFHLGRSFAGSQEKVRSRKVEVEIVGLSTKALLLGATIPIDYVREFNEHYRGEEASKDYDSVLVKVESADKVPMVVSAIEKEGFELAPRSRDALRVGMLISILVIAFSFISLIIVGIAAISVAHTFFTLVSERRRELGLLRALGASRGDVRNLILTEAVAAGMFFGLAGLGLGLIICKLSDLMATQLLPDFPFKPDSFFILSPGLLLGGLALAMLFSLAGALFPAVKAARLDPAEALMPK